MIEPDVIANETEAPAETPAAPPGHYWATIKGRPILVAALTTAQSLIVSGLFRQAKDADLEQNLAILGKLALLFETIIVRPEDRDWLEDGMLRGVILTQDFAYIFLATRTEETGSAKKKPRRGR